MRCRTRTCRGLRKPLEFVLCQTWGLPRPWPGSPVRFGGLRKASGCSGALSRRQSKLRATRRARDVSQGVPKKRESGPLPACSVGYSLRKSGAPSQSEVSRTTAGHATHVRGCNTKESVVGGPVFATSRPLELLETHRAFIFYGADVYNSKFLVRHTITIFTQAFLSLVGCGSSGQNNGTLNHCIGGLEAVWGESANDAGPSSGGTNWGGSGTGTPTMAGRTLKAPTCAAPAQVQTVVAGCTHTCAITKTGGLRCWGDDSSGQLGDGCAVMVSGGLHGPGLLPSTRRCDRNRLQRLARLQLRRWWGALLRPSNRCPTATFGWDSGLDDWLLATCGKLEYLRDLNVFHFLWHRVRFHLLVASGFCSTCCCD